jgi:hypothetical protein
VAFRQGHGACHDGRAVERVEEGPLRAAPAIAEAVEHVQGVLARIEPDVRSGCVGVHCAVVDTPGYLSGVVTCRRSRFVGEQHLARRGRDGGGVAANIVSVVTVGTVVEQPEYTISNRDGERCGPVHALVDLPALGGLARALVGIACNSPAASVVVSHVGRIRRRIRLKLELTKQLVAGA